MALGRSRRSSDPLFPQKSGVESIYPLNRPAEGEAFLRELPRRLSQPAGQPLIRQQRDDGVG
jgi:hypothetical protein